jgi:hypothetical protein
LLQALWEPSNHLLFEEEVVGLVETMVMIHALEETSGLCLLPTELLHEIFQCYTVLFYQDLLRSHRLKPRYS